MSKIEIKDHIFKIEVKKEFLISADYPYYRDKTSLWKKKVEILKELGIDAITCYIPWRHHASYTNGKQKFDFTGETRANRNILKFIEIVKKTGLYLVLKPGPFIHAETDAGGLPDFILPGISDCEGMKDYKNVVREWSGCELPSPVDIKFKKAVKVWYEAVDRKVLKKNLYPEGPVILLQICNEGIYTDSPMSPLSFDFSSHSIKLFQKYCRKIYKTVRNYNRLHNTTLAKFSAIYPHTANIIKNKISNSELLNIMDWRTYQNYYTAEVFNSFSNFLKSELPYVTNAALPYFCSRYLDYWICRNSYYLQTGLHQGFTNWVGVVSDDESAFNKYMFSIKYIKGINWEENWGFSKLYHPYYAYPVTPYYQTLLAIALGCKGFNVYTGAATAGWDKGLDSKYSKPYPADPPIDKNGNPAPNSSSLRLLVTFFKEEQEDFLKTSPSTEIVYILDLYYSAAVSVEKNKDKRLDHLFNGKTIMNFISLCKKNNINYDLFNVFCEKTSILKKYKYIILPSAFFMSRKLQKTAVSLLEQGKKILWFGELPDYDEKFEKYNLLKNYLIKTGRKNFIKINGQGSVNKSKWEQIFKRFKISSEINTSKNNIFLQRFVSPDNQIVYYFIFSFSNNNQELKIELPEGKLECNLAAKSAVVFKIKNGDIIKGILKNVNERLKKSVPIKLLVNGHGIKKKTKEDIIFEYYI